MKELKRKYQEAKQMAVQLMEKGTISEYIAHLVTVQELRLQMMNASIVRSR